MKTFLLIAVSLILSGCMKMPDLPSFENFMAKEEVQANQEEADQAKKEYEALQSQRSSE